MLKHSLLAFMLAGLLYTQAPLLLAQDAASNPQPSAPSATAPERGEGHHHFDPGKQTQRLTKKLNLTSDQQTKVQDILTSAQSQMQGLRADTSMSQEDRRSKMMEIHKTSSDQIRALLDASQQKKFDEMRSKRGHWKHDQGGQEPGSGPSGNS